MNNMKKAIVLLLTLSVPVMLFLSIHQVYRYQQLEGEIEGLRNTQIELFESNKRMIANIAILSSPKRIAKIARESFRLEPRGAEEGVMRIVFRKERD